MPGRDPRYRRYRASLWVIYFALILLGVGIMVVSVTRHLRGPSRSKPIGPLPTRAALRVCLAELETLYREQHLRAWALGDEVAEGAPFAVWSEWARLWEGRVADLSDRCRLDVDDPKQEGYAERTQMATARDAMLALHRAYGAHLNRFAGEHRDLLRAASDALAKARASVSPDR